MKINLRKWGPVLVLTIGPLFAHAQVSGPDKRVQIVHSTDTLVVFDPDTFTETYTIETWSDTLIYHNRNKVEVRKQPRGRGANMPLGENLDFIQRHRITSDTIIIYDPEKQEMQIVFPNPEDK